MKLSGDQHVVRFCLKRYYNCGEIDPAAFHLRDKEKNLSTRWYEECACDLDRVREDMRDSGFRGLAGGGLALLNVADVSMAVLCKLSLQLEFVQDYPRSDPSHVSVCGFTLSHNDEVGKQMWRCVSYHEAA